MALLDFREPVNAWSHGLWLLLSIPATWVLWSRCEGDRAKRLSLLIFGLSLSVCYAGSTLFHAVRLPEIWISRFDELDHVGIFVLIAGSYTPVAWNHLQGRLRWGTLASVWLLCVLGSAFLLSWGVFSMFWSTCFYMAMGWGAIICYIEMTRKLSHRALFPLLLGGFLYTTGAVINLVHWPILRPGVFAEHELFHLFVMAGSLAHFWFMLNVVAPGRRATAAREWSVTRTEPVRLPGGGCQPLFLLNPAHWDRDERN